MLSQWLLSPLPLPLVFFVHIFLKMFVVSYFSSFVLFTVWGNILNRLGCFVLPFFFLDICYLIFHFFVLPLLQLPFWIMYVFSACGVVSLVLHHHLDCSFIFPFSVGFANM